ncbi:MAG: hypothetical protein ABSC23_09815 [Bryobacteraceae bacterium]|jgi:DNA-binding NtrC family response regulator
MKEPDHEQSVTALLVGEYGNDRLLMRDIFHNLGWRLMEAPARREAMNCLRRNPVQVVLAESEVPHWGWKKILGDLRGLARPPQLIVTSRSADECLWSEVLNLGAYDVLARPLARDEVERVIDSALRHLDPHPDPAGVAYV